jgi:polar amino acid transport system substrate-binding protein
MGRLMKRSFARGRFAGWAGVLAVLAAFGLGACSSSGGSQDGASGQTSGAASAVNSLAALLPTRIAKSGTLVVGIDKAGSSSMETTSGSDIVGLDPDLIKAVGKELGVDVKIRPASFDSLIAGVQAGRYDITIAGMADTKEREQSVSFVDYLNVGVAVVVKKGNPAHIHGADDLCGRNVAVETGGYPQAVLVPALSAKCTKAGMPALHGRTFGDNSSGVLAVQSGRADCLYSDAATSAYLLKTTSEQFEQAGQSQTLARAGIAFPKTDTQLGSAIESAVQELMTSGQYAAMAKRWGLTGVTIPKAETNHALL